MPVKRRPHGEGGGGGQHFGAAATSAHQAPHHYHRQGDAPHHHDYGQLVGLHRSKCWDWTPSAVVALAACPGAPLLAVGLESGGLQLWELNHMVCIQTVVGFAVEVTAVTWVKDSLNGTWRTIAAALDGSIAEVSWQQGQLVSPTDSGAGAVWALAAQPLSAVRPGFAHQIAAGCDDGSVRIFSVEGGEPGVSYERTLTHLRGRVLTLAWHPSGKSVLAGGADGCIHALDPTTGNESLRITVSASTAQPVCVWRVLVLKDGTIVSGDSSGAVQFWDAQFGTLLQRFATYAADVLALAASPSGAQVWASGVDSKVTLFEQTGAAGGHGRQQSIQWVYTHHKRPHTHDVRAMDVVHVEGGPGVLVSGGADAQLLVYPASSSFLSVHPARLTKAPQSPLCAITTAPSLAKAAAEQAAAAAAAGGGHRGRRGPAPVPAPLPAAPPCRLLCAQDDRVDVWQVGSTPLSGSEDQAGVPIIEGHVIDLTAAPRHIARICVSGAGRVSAAAIAPDGRYVAVTSGPGAALRVYQLPAEQQQQGGAQPVSPAPVHRVPCASALNGVTAVAVSNSYVLTANTQGQVCVHQLPSATDSAEDSAAKQGKIETVAQCSVLGTDDRVQPSKAKGGLAGPSWAGYIPAVNRLCVSPDGKGVAAATAAGVVLLSLTTGRDGGVTLQRTGSVQLPSDAPVTAMCLSPDGALVGVALASAHLLVIDVAARRPTAWSLHNREGIATCVARLPGTPSGVTFSPSGQQILVHSSGGFCVFDLARPVEVPLGQDFKRRRGPAKPQDGPQSVAGAGPVVDHMARGQQRGQQAAGANGRAMLLSDPVAFVSFLGDKELLALEKPWEDVLATLPPPVFRHRYGN